MLEARQESPPPTADTGISESQASDSADTTVSPDVERTSDRSQPEPAAGIPYILLSEGLDNQVTSQESSKSDTGTDALPRVQFVEEANQLAFGDGFVDFGNGGRQQGRRYESNPASQILGGIIRDVIDGNNHQQNQGRRYRQGYPERTPYGPRVEQQDPTSAVINGVLRQVLDGGSSPGRERIPFTPGRYNPANPGFDRQPNRYRPPQFQPERFTPRQFNPRTNPLPFVQDGPGGAMLEQILQQGIRTLQQNPEIMGGIAEMLGLPPNTDLQLDPDRKEITLSTDFSALYDKMARENPERASEQTRKLAQNLETVRMGPDTLDFKFRGEQQIAMGGDGQAKDFKLVVGGDRGWTTFDVSTTETSLTLDNIRGLQAIDPSGKRISVHGIKIDTSDAKNPKGNFTIDNPVPRPDNVPADVEWPATIDMPINLPKDNPQLIESLPDAVRSMHSARSGVKSGNLLALKDVDMSGMKKLFEALNAKRPDNPDPQPRVTPDVRPAPRDRPAPAPFSLDDLTIQQVVKPPAPGTRPQPESEFRPKRPEPEIEIPESETTDKQGGVSPAADIFGIVDRINIKPAPKTADTTAPTTQKRNPLLPPINITGGDSNPLLRRIENPDSESRPSSILPDSSRSSDGRRDQSPLDLDLLPGFRPQRVTITPERKPAGTDRPEQQPEQRPRPGDNGRRTTADILTDQGLEVTVDKSSAKAFLESVLKDSQGPIKDKILAQFDDRSFLRKLERTGATISRFDVDTDSKSITLGMDFSLAYHSFAPYEGETAEQRGKVREFLSGMDSVTVTPDRLTLNMGEPRMLEVAKEGSSETQKIWMGLANGRTTFDVKTTGSRLTLKNIQGLEAEVELLGKRLAIHEIAIDASNPEKPAGTVVVDNPLPKPDAVPEEYWPKTQRLPIPMDDAKPEEIERLPRVFAALHKMRQDAQQGVIAEVLDGMTREDLIAMLKAPR